MTNFSMYFQQILHGTPGWATCPFKMFFFSLFCFCFLFFCFCFVLFFVLKVPMDDINSAVHCLKSFAQDAAQAGRALAQGVPAPGWWGSRGLASGEGCKGETPPYLTNFYMQFWGLKGALLPWLKKKKKKKKSFWGAKNLRFPSLSLFFQTF